METTTTTTTTTSTLFSSSSLTHFPPAVSLTPHKRPSPLIKPLQCHKMYVSGFGEASPESKAAKHLHDFFTYVAVKIVTAQLQSYNPEAYADLMHFLETHSLSDGDQFCADLMRVSSTHKTLALRILEVRSAYCKSDFEWDNLKRLSMQMIEDRNIQVMKEYLSETSSVKDPDPN